MAEGTDDANKKLREMKPRVASADGVQTFEEDASEGDASLENLSDRIRAKGRFTGQNGPKLTPNAGK